MDIYLLAFMLIVLVGSVITYVFYLKEKKEQLDSIRRGFCPRCKQDHIELTDQRSSGCSGPQMMSFECLECGYINSFAVQDPNSCCGSGGCS
jgi:RNase P subunit RPR2